MKSISNTSIPVLLEWYYNNTSKCSNISFVVEITNTKENKIFIEQTNNNYIWLNKLYFNIKYNVRVKPSFNNESGQFSEIREIFVKKYPMIPQYFRSINSTNTSIVLQWNYPVEPEQTIYVDGYTIIMMPLDKSFNTSQTQISIDDLLPCKQYCFTIIAFNKAGKSNTSDNVCTSTKTTFHNIESISIKVISSNARLVEWIYEDIYNCNIIFDIKLINEKKNELIKQFNTILKTVIIEDLIPNNYYKINITPKTIDENSKIVFYQVFHTIQVPSIPNEIKIIDKTDTSIQINWTKSIQTNLFGYAEWYQMNISDGQIISTNQTQILIINLSPCRKYCFEIYAVNIAGKSENSANICTNTKLGKFDDVIFENRNYDSLPILFKWRYENKLKCENISFNLQIFSPNNLTALYSIETRNKSYAFDKLEFNEHYRVKIRAGFNEEFGEFSGNIEIFIKKLPAVPDNIRITNKTSTTLTIQWDSIQTNNKFDKKQSIVYEIIKKDILNDDKYNTTNQYYTFNELSPCTEYCYAITAFNFIGKSEQSNEICETTESNFNKIEELQPIINKDNSFIIRWKYNNTNDCPVQYKVEYIMKSHFKQKHYKITKYQNITINKFEAEQIGKVKISPINKNEIGKYSIHIELNKITVQKSKIIVLYVFIIIFLLLIIGYVIYSKDLLLLKIKQITDRNSVLVIETRPVRTEIKTSHKNDYVKLKEISNLNQISQKSKCDLPLENKELSKEFKEINSKAQNYEILHLLTTQIGQLIENKSKNRFTNILPYDQTRVILKRSPPKSDYINANYIPFIQNIHKYEYIASQGPINDTISDFWQMIWENNVSIIVMLTRTYEEDKFKCLQYWPENIDEKIEFGENKEFQVSIEEETNRNSFVERKLQIFNKMLKENRFIIHLHMTEWFDYSAPNLSEFESLMFRFQEIAISRENHPYLIHCSAGVGRTGTFIVLDRIIRKLIDGNMNIDICAEILELRKYRKMMVQRAAQYIFIHEFVQYFNGKYISNNSNNKNQDDNIYFNS